MILVLHSIYDLGAVWYLLPPSPTQFGLGGSEKNSHCEIESQRLSANTSCNFCDRKNLKKVCRSGENSYNLPILAVAVCRRHWHQPGTVRQSSGAARLPRQSQSCGPEHEGRGGGSWPTTEEVAALAIHPQSSSAWDTVTEAAPR